MYQERPVMAMNAAALNGIKNSNQNGKIEFTSGFKIIFFALIFLIHRTFYLRNLDTDCFHFLAQMRGRHFVVK